VILYMLLYPVVVVHRSAAFKTI